MFRFLSKNSSIQKDGGNILIMMFHSIRKPKDGAIGPMSQNMSLNEFEKLIKQLNENFKIISIEELVSRRFELDDQHKEYIVLTFDDGYKDTYTDAFTVLEKYQVPATVYITTGFMDGTEYPYEFVLAKILENTSCITCDIEGESIERDVSGTHAKETTYSELCRKMRSLDPAKKVSIPAYPSPG